MTPSAATPLSAAESVHRALVRMFAAPFEVLDLDRDDDSAAYGRHLRRLAAAAGAENADVCLFGLPSGPEAHDLPNGRLLLVVPVTEEEGGTRAVAGVITGRSVDLALRLATSAFDLVQYWEEVSELHSQLDEFAVQVSADFEELAWLRELAGYLELCEVGTGLGEVAAAALPRLREVIGAEVVAVVPAEENGSAVSDGCLFHHGGGGVTADDVATLVRRLSPTAVGRPAVRNGLDLDPAFADLPAVTSCVVVPLVRGERTYGWLVAVNRVRPVCRDGRLSRLGDDEFGTVEAGLVGSAAAMLTTHARNAELFRERHEAG